MKTFKQYFFEAINGPKIIMIGGPGSGKSTYSNLIKKELGWKVDEIEGIPEKINPNGEKTECYMQASRDYIKYLKRGYSRATQMTSFQVRNNRMTTEEAKKIISEYDGLKPKSLEILLEYLKIDEKQFNKIISKMIVPPNKPNFETKWQVQV